MSLFQMRCFSKTLNMATEISIILPLPRDVQAEASDLPVLYLLHGMGDDDTSWMRKTSIERYALEHRIAVVMPDGVLSCYENMVHGAHYRDYIAMELPQIIQTNFPVSRDRERNFIAGCSMGGCGALKLAMAYPEKWSRVGCFSASHLEYRPDSPRNQAMIRRAFGDQLQKRDAEIIQDIQSANAGSLPLNVQLYWGDHDILREHAQLCRDHFESLPEGSIHCEWKMLPGSHDWALWDACIRQYLLSLELPKPEVQLF